MRLLHGAHAFCLNHLFELDLSGVLSIASHTVFYATLTQYTTVFERVTMIHIPQHRSSNKRNRIAKKHHRRALSVLESIGCVAAIGTGIWLGATYLGLDLKAVWN